MQTVVLGYRQAFYERLRDELDRRGIDLHVVHHPAIYDNLPVEVAQLPWLEVTSARVVRLGPMKVIRAALPATVLEADLVVIEQAARLVSNLRLLFRRSPQRVAFWGHGHSRDDATASGAGEWLKQKLLHASDWFFAYTDAVVDYLAASGYDRSRVTVVNNTSDTEGLANALERCTPDDVAAVRDEFGLAGDNLCIFLGTLRPVRRFDLLLEAADLIREQVPDFELVFIGKGDQEGSPVEDFCATRMWAHAAGARFDDDLAAIASGAKLILAPGWAGLVVVDSFALGVPLVASNSGSHPPEIAYLTDGVNGRLVDDGGVPAEYAAAAIDLLTDEVRRQVLVAGARASRSDHTVDAMAARFADGVLAALAD